MAVTSKPTTSNTKTATPMTDEVITVFLANHEKLHQIEEAKFKARRDAEAAMELRRQDAMNQAMELAIQRMFQPVPPVASRATLRPEETYRRVIAARKPPSLPTAIAAPHKSRLLRPVIWLVWTLALGLGFAQLGIDPTPRNVAVTSYGFILLSYVGWAVIAGWGRD
jgi:hypothetical protein